jgi:hypothetical protein
MVWRILPVLGSHHSADKFIYSALVTVLSIYDSRVFYAPSYTVNCPDFYTGRFRFESKLEMLISVNERFQQEINADQRHTRVVFRSFPAHFQIVLDRTKPIPHFGHFGGENSNTLSEWFQRKRGAQIAFLLKQANTTASEQVFFMKTNILGWFSRKCCGLHAQSTVYKCQRCSTVKYSTVQSETNS